MRNFERNSDFKLERKFKGTVLIFLPGLHEIEVLANMLSSEKKKYSLEILKLHSQISLDEQALAFQTFPDNVRKIILATNIAESSITINDVVYGTYYFKIINLYFFQIL